MLNNRIYDILKWIVVIAVPAICTLIVTLNSLWHWDLPVDAIVGTLTAISTFVGVLIGISTIQYNNKNDNEGGDDNG